MLFEPQSEDAIREMVESIIEADANQFGTDVEMAVDFLEGRQEGHTDTALREWFKSSMEVESDQEMKAVVLPLTKKYIEESANAYDKPVRRWFSEDDGTETDATKEVTSQYQKQLGLARYDETMHTNERLMHLFKPAPSSLWWQAKRGNVRPVLVLPSQIFPDAPDHPVFMDASDPGDYDGFVIEVLDGDSLNAKVRTFAYQSAAQVTFYEGTPKKVDRILSQFDNPYMWPQQADEVVEGADGKLSVVTHPEAELPLMPLTFWHVCQPIGPLIPGSDMPIVRANLVVNVLFSALMDNIRVQGHAIPVMKLTNPGSPKARRRYGSRFPIVVDVNEVVEMISAATNYSDQMTVIKDFVRLLAMTENQSPNDFNIDGIAPASGLAKIMDSLPKIEARDKSLRRLHSHETQVAGPLNISVLTTIGKLDQSARKMRYNVQFSDLKFPQTEDDKTKALDRDVKHHTGSAAEWLSRREGITIEEAETRIEANRERNAASAPATAQQSSGINLGALGFGNRVRQSGGSGDGRDARNTARRDRSARAAAERDEE